MNDYSRNILGWAVFAVLAYILYRIAGKNKREFKSVPVGMQLLAERPMMRYMMYVLGIFLFLFLEGISIFAVADAGAEELGGILYVMIAAGVFMLVLFLLLGHVMYARHMYFNEEKIVIGKPFRSPRTLYWNEVSKVKMTKYAAMVYDGNGKRCVTAQSRMIGYEEFRLLVEKKYGDKS